MKPKKAGAATTLGARAIERAGWRGGYHGLSHAADWWICAAALGRDSFTVDEFAEWWLCGRRSAFRGQLAFRKCFPEYSTPTELAHAIGYDFASLKKSDQPRVIVDLVGWAV